MWTPKTHIEKEYMISLISAIFTGTRKPLEDLSGYPNATEQELKLYHLVCSAYYIRRDIDAFKSHISNNADPGNRVGAMLIGEQAILAELEYEIVKLLQEMRK